MLWVHHSIHESIDKQKPAVDVARSVGDHGISSINGNVFSMLLRTSVVCPGTRSGSSFLPVLRKNISLHTVYTFERTPFS